MAESHQPRGVVSRLGFFDKLSRRQPRISNIREHFDHFLIGPTVTGSPERLNSGGDGAEEVHHRRTHHPDGTRRAVLFVVGVEDQQ